MFLIFCFLIIILLFWLEELTGSKKCPNCHSTLSDKIPNGYHCRYCGKMWIMNLFGRLKERK